jgi:aspartate ammonia-lyase
MIVKKPTGKRKNDMPGFRIETDLLGQVRVPVNAIYGAQTQRAVENFPVFGQKTIGDYPWLIVALMRIKQAAAECNRRIGALDDERAEAIRKAAETVMAEKMFDAFPVHFLHGGGGTSANMNANEVLANLAEELLGGRRGEYRRIHPNDHVNLNQSTNDVYPTACHMAVVAEWPSLESSLKMLESVLEQKIREFGDCRRLARTCLQDAVETTFADFFGGYVGAVVRCRERIASSVDSVRSVNLGGTIVGRRQDAPSAYRRGIVGLVNRIAPEYRLRPCRCHFDSAQNPDDLANVSAQLDLLARTLIKIGSDLRFLGSGPEAGVHELILPSVQPGSSIMPGKINPVIPEFLAQIGFRVCGNHRTCTMALDHGELDLNVWESAMVFPILDSMELLETALRSLTEKCLDGIVPDMETNARHCQSIIPQLVRLAGIHGYSTISKLCKDAGGEPGNIRVAMCRRRLAKD